MHSLNKIPPSHKQLFDSFEAQHGINVEMLAYYYGTTFALKVIESIEHKGNAHANTVPIVVPSKMPKGFLQKMETREEYIRRLKNAGLKLRTWTENETDKENGQVRPVYRCEMFYLDHESYKKQTHHA